MDFDYLVIGGGSGGLASSMQAAKLGAKVAIVEPKDLGGTCVNRGCVPKKIMWLAANMSNHIKNSTGYGFKINEDSLDWQKLIKNREEYINNIQKAYIKKLEDLSITHINGYARILNNNTIEVKNKIYQARHILIATGAKPKIPDLPGSECGITSDGFFKLSAQPKEVIIVGGGYIAIELASTLNSLGTHTTILLRGENLLKGFEHTLTTVLRKTMTESGIKIIDNAAISKVENKKRLLNIYSENAKDILETECLIWATGRIPNTDQLDLVNTKVQVDEKGFIVIDEWQNTTAENIYAIGDVTKNPALTPLAVVAGKNVAIRLFGKQAQKVNYNLTPTVIFSHPPLATIGCTEEVAREKYKEVKVYQKEFTSMDTAFYKNKITSIIKLITGGADEKIVGCHILGPNADEIIQGFSVAITMGATKRDFDNCLAIHPTSAEELVLL